MADEITFPEVDDKGQPLNPPPANEGAAEPPKPAVENPAEDDDVDDPVVPVRSNAAHIIARKNRQIEKLRSQQAADDGDDEGDDDDSKPVTRADLKPFIETISGSENEKELQSLFAENPESKKYEKRIKAYMEHPAWQQVPVSAIYHHLAFEAAAKAGAKQKNAADLEAAQMASAGSSHRPPATSGLTSDDIDGMSDEELEAMSHKIRTGQTVQ